MFIELTGVTKTYGEGSGTQKVLNNIDLFINKGERCAILGPSGSGKSTLLNLIGGLDSADSGRISISDIELTGLNQKELVEYRRSHLGFVFQLYNLVPNLTIRENIQVCSFLTKNPMDIDEIIENLGLSEHKDKYPSQVSGGQQQRCSFARALVKKPDLLLCDEPTGALDSASSKEMLKLIEKISDLYNTTILIVTHNEVIEEMCHRVINIKDGKIIENRVNSSLTPAKDLVL